MIDNSEIECKFFYRMNGDYRDHTSAKIFYLMFNALDDFNIDLINTEDMQRRCDEVFKYIFLLKRFNNLVKLSNNSVYSSLEGFNLEGHVFETLDEVQKALENKAFL